MFADPQTVTVATVAQTLPAVERNGQSSVYKKDNDDYKLIVSHQYGRRKRFTVRLDGRKIAPDPLVASNNNEYSASVYLVMDAPTVGYTNAEIGNIASALRGWATDANLLKVLGGET